MAWSGYRKAKQGPQQGTLFDVREVPSQPVDSPGMRKRARRAEMFDAMPEDTGVRRFEGAHRSVLSTVRKRSGIDSPLTPNTGGILERTDHGADRHHRAALSRQFADETTVPPSDLGGLEGIRVGARGLGQDVGGKYQDRRILTPDAYPDTGTLTHELGHHVSLHHEGNTPTDAAGLGSGIVISPGEEGRADAYALEHAPEARRGRTYANLVRGMQGTNYVGEREERGQPLDDDERYHQGMPIFDRNPLQMNLVFPKVPGR